MPALSNGSFLDFDQAYQKTADYCALQDRCISEIKLKLRVWNIDKSYYNKIISKLINEGFLDEKRFAINYAGGKFRIKSWGKLKIAAGLRARSIPAPLIQHALASIDRDDYILCLEALLKKKLKQLGSNTQDNRQKAAYFAASRGFETGLIAVHLHNTELFDF